MKSADLTEQTEARPVRFDLGHVGMPETVMYARSKKEAEMYKKYATKTKEKFEEKERRRIEQNKADFRLMTFAWRRFGYGVVGMQRSDLWALMEKEEKEEEEKKKREAAQKKRDDAKKKRLQAKSKKKQEADAPKKTSVTGADVDSHTSK